MGVTVGLGWKCLSVCVWGGGCEWSPQGRISPLCPLSLAHACAPVSQCSVWGVCGGLCSSASDLGWSSGQPWSRAQAAAPKVEPVLGSPGSDPSLVTRA